MAMGRPAQSMLLVACAAALLAGVPRGSESGAATLRRSGAAATPRSVHQQPGGSGWSANATAFRGQNGARFDYTCPFYGAAGAVYGTDVYTDDSSVCTAAVHAGRITLAGGGSLTIEIQPGQQSYTGSTRNGITSNSWGSWGGSFVIVAAKPGNPGVGSGGTGWELTATRFRTFLGAQFAYGCPANGKPGSVWGTDVYTDDSSVCTAGVHAGRITVAKGGTVTIEMRSGQDSYTGSTRNGITSNSWGSWGGSYVVVGAGGAAPPPTGTTTGTVLVNGQPFTGGTIPYRSIVDVSAGTLNMSTDLGDLTVHGTAGVTGEFKLLRPNASHIDLDLVGGDFSACGRALAAADRKKKKVGLLWAKGKGHFHSAGRDSIASVHGTQWLTEDRCDGTLTVVKEGVVTVKDLRRRKTVTVHAGQSYLALHNPTRH